MPMMLIPTLNQVEIGCHHKFDIVTEYDTEDGSCGLKCYLCGQIIPKDELPLSLQGDVEGLDPIKDLLVLIKRKLQNWINKIKN